MIDTITSWINDQLKKYWSSSLAMRKFIVLITIYGIWVLCLVSALFLGVLWTFVVIIFNFHLHGLISKKFIFVSRFFDKLIYKEGEGKGRRHDFSL